MKVNCSERYPFYDIHGFGPDLKLTDATVDWIKSTMEEFELVQMYLGPRFDRAEAIRLRLGQINQMRKQAKGMPNESEITAALDKSVEELTRDPR